MSPGIGAFSGAGPDVYALASFKDHDHSEAASFGGDFGDMIARFSKDLPSGLVHQAIDVVLDQAEL